MPTIPPSHPAINELGASTLRGDAVAVLAEMGNDLRAKRGTLPDVELAGVEGTGTSGAHTIPFLTNRDAIQLADYWSQWLAEVPNTDGDGILVRARWHDALDDVDALARPEGPDARYAESPELWAACAAVAAYISAASKTPSPRNAKRSKRDDVPEQTATDAQANGGEVDDAKNGPDEPLDDSTDAVLEDDLEIDRDDPIEQFAARLFELRTERGADLLPTPRGWFEPLAHVARLYNIPRLTNADAIQLAADWSALLAGPLGRSPVMGTDSARAVLGEWRWVVYEVKRVTHSADPDALYERRNRFVRALNNLAICLSAAYHVAEDEQPRNAPGLLASDTLAAAPMRVSDVFGQRVDPLAIYTAFLQKYRAERGADLFAPSRGFTGIARAIPRTTNHDVLTLAAWCSDMLAETPHVAGTTGDEIKRWADAVASVNFLAWQGDPDAEYERNDEFWPALGAVVTLMSAMDDVRFGQNAIYPRNASWSAPPFGPFTPDIKTLDDIYRAQLAALRTQRGTDNGPGFGGATIAVPRTTNADVVELADWWNALYTDQKDHIADVVQTSGSHFDTALWDAALTDVNSVARTRDANSVYPHNAEFWRALGDLATETAQAVELPASWLYDVTHHTDVGEFVLSGIHAAEALPGKLADAAKTVGTAIKARVWDDIKWPVYIGGGALVTYLLTRRHEER